MKRTFIYIIFNLTILSIFACDMFLLQGIDTYPYFNNVFIPGDFNDPSDFFEEFKTLSNQTSSNRDGYGIVSYKYNNPIIERDYMWYKIGLGSYFDSNNPDEPLYEAIYNLYNNPDINITLAHTRSATGGYGNHPFLLNFNDKTYSFMHNGYVFNTIKENIINYLGPEWFADHPSQWDGDYNNPASFIDSELIFYYFMSFIINNNGDIATAFRQAFNYKSPNEIDMEFILKHNTSTIVNFVMSDGINSYVYRSSPLAGDLYNLSYENYDNEFIAVKTGSSLAHIINKNQLLKITPQGEIEEMSIEPLLKTSFYDEYVEKVDENLFKLHWNVSYITDISHFNIYRSLNKNMTSAVKIATIPSQDNITSYSTIDNFHSLSAHYYWIEVVYQDNYSEISSLISSNQEQDDPDEPDNSGQVILYPNPFDSELKISLVNQEKTYIHIYNIKGQLIDTFLYEGNGKNYHTWNPNLSTSKHLANGIYILKFKSKNKTYTRKIVHLK